MIDPPRMPPDHPDYFLSACEAVDSVLLAIETEAERLGWDAATISKALKKQAMQRLMAAADNAEVDRAIKALKRRPPRD